MKVIVLNYLVYARPLHPAPRLTWDEYACVRTTIERYKKVSADSSNSGCTVEANSQYYQQESSKLRQQIGILQNANRHLMGEALSSMNVKELKQLENRLEKGISRIRSKKKVSPMGSSHEISTLYVNIEERNYNELLFAEIEYMQKREIDLQNDNMYLRAKISENERAAQQMNMLPAGHEYEVMPAFDSRNFLQVNLMDSNHYHQEQTNLQLR
ncbi:Agamous-like MADS-box protein mads1 [Asimina triloba]